MVWLHSTVLDKKNITGKRENSNETLLLKKSWSTLNAEKDFNSQSAHSSAYECTD